MWARKSFYPELGNAEFGVFLMVKPPTMSLSSLLWAAASVAIIFLLFSFFRRRYQDKRTLHALRDRLRRQEDELKRVRDQDDARNLFLASLSHELRTPLSGITGAIRLLRATGLNTRQQEYARMAAGASATVLAIVDDMLTFSRIQAGKVHVENAMFGLRTLIDDMLSLQNIKAQERGIVLVRDVAIDVPEYLFGDAGKLKQVLLNLLGNALKFSDEGSVIVAVTRVSQPDSDAVQLAFVVSDTGTGIPPEQLPKIFEPFVQGEGATRGGTGLGLAISRRLVQAMGGELSLESEFGVGTTLRFQLQFMPAAVPKATEQPTVMRTEKGRASFKVLVIEDDEINRLVCTRYLALAGHHPLAAAEAGQAFKWADHAAELPDAVLLDMHLGSESGVDVLAKLCARYPQWQTVPVLAMSADISGQAQQQAMKAGLQGFLGKPFSAGQLDAELRSILSGRAHRQARPPSAEGLLDLSFLEEERATLGDDVLLELLNIFRAGAATRLAAMALAAERGDWQVLKQQAHALQGSAANLGLSRVLLLARSLQIAAAEESDCIPAEIQKGVNALELAVHDGADALRAFLVTSR